MLNMKERLDAAVQRAEGVGTSLQREEDELRGIKRIYNTDPGILGYDPKETLKRAERLVEKLQMDYHIWKGSVLELAMIVREMEETGVGEWMDD